MSYNNNNNNQDKYYQDQQQTLMLPYKSSRNSKSTSASSPGPAGSTVEESQSSYENREFNTSAVTVWVADDIFYLQPKYNNQYIPTVLKIHRKLQTIEQLTHEQFRIDKIGNEQLRKDKSLDNEQKYTRMEALNFSALVGIIDLAQINIGTQSKEGKGKKVLVMAEIIQLSCSVNYRNIYKIIKPVFLFYDPKDKQKLNDEEASLLLNLGFILEQGMYYSYTYNLTLPFRSMQTSANQLEHFQSRMNTNSGSSASNDEKKVQQPKQQPKQKEKQDTTINSKDNIGDKQKQKEQENDHQQFNWAFVMQKQLKKYHKNWSVPLIQGFINKVEVYVNAVKFKMVLISRRSRKNGGPLQYATGLSSKQLDQKSNLTKSKPYNKNSANYVETELIVHIKSLYFSFIQVRGTAPLYWQYQYSYGIAFTITVSESIETNYRDFSRHIKSIKKSHNFDNVILLNLLQKNAVNTQRKLIQNFEYIVRKCEKDLGLFYVYYDLHEKCSNKDYREFDKFINNEMSQILKSCGFSVFQHRPMQRLEKLQSQRGIIRTNCATCIDRTNIAQSRIAAWQMVYILRTLNIKIANMNESLDFIEDGSPFAKLYRNLWADNGDAISQQYSGTMSMQSATIRTGKISYMASIDHGLTSILRAVRNLTDQDNGKSRAVLFLSKSSPNKYQSSPNKQRQKMGEQKNSSQQKLA